MCGVSKLTRIKWNQVTEGDLLVSVDNPDRKFTVKEKSAYHVEGYIYLEGICYNHTPEDWEALGYLPYRKRPLGYTKLTPGQAIDALLAGKDVEGKSPSGNWHTYTSLHSFPGPTNLKKRTFRILKESA